MSVARAGALKYLLSTAESLLFIMGMMYTQGMRGSLRSRKRRWRVALEKWLVLKSFTHYREEWETFRDAVLRILGTIKRQGYKDLGLRNPQTVKGHTLHLVFLVKEIATDKGWSESCIKTAVLIAQIHDFVESFGGDVPVIKTKLPFKRIDRVLFQQQYVSPATPEDERARLANEWREERMILYFYLTGSVHRGLRWAILWCFDQYYLPTTPEGLLVQQAHYLETVLTAKAYEEKEPWFGKSKGAESFFTRAELVISDPDVRERFNKARKRKDNPTKVEVA